ncbi:MAG: universal stress protein [Rhodospirillales bacterium]|nr:universal stress protein [Rhodospirillales bacterium]
MAIRDLLIHVDTTPAAGRRLDLAVALAARLEARLIGFFAAADSHVQGLSSLTRQEHLLRVVANAEPSFHERAAAAGVAAEWRSTVPRDDVGVAREVIHAARSVDLVVLGQFDPGSADGALPPTLVEQTVMRSGRPVLVVPFAGTFNAMARRVIIAWNGSREAARALNDALPLLADADEVTVLALAPVRPASPMGEAASTRIVRHLNDHGIAAKPDRLVFKAREIDPAERLLSHLADCAADLLVMGAWPRTGERNSLTTGVLARTTVPMLLSY